MKEILGSIKRGPKASSMKTEVVKTSGDTIKEGLQELKNRVLDSELYFKHLAAEEGTSQDVTWRLNNVREKYLQETWAKEFLLS